MAVPISSGPQQNTAAKKRETTGPANSDKPVQPSEARPPSATGRDVEKKRPAAARPGATDRDATKKGPELAQAVAATHCREESPVSVPGTAAAAPSCDSSSALDGGKAKHSSDQSAKNGGTRDAGAVASDSGGLEPKKRLQVAATTQQGGEKGPGEDPAAAFEEKCKKSSQSNALFCSNSSARDDGKIKEKELEIGSAKNSGTPNVAAVACNSVCLDPKKRLQLTAAAAAAAAATTASEKRGAQGAEASPAAACAPGVKQSAAEGGSKHHDEDGDKMGVGVWKFISLPWMQQQRRTEGPDLSWKSTSLLNRLFECCGLIDLIVGKGLDVSLSHVNEQKILICEAKYHYNMEESVADKLSELYSSFRVVLGDGECFYRSFIYSYLELVLDNDDTSEEDRLLCSTEKISIACMGLELYDDFCKHHKAFQELVQKVKSWKTEARAVRRMLLLTYFGDYKDTEAIFSFLRISSAAWILTHPELAAFHIEDDIPLEEFCRLQIIQRRSYADSLAITGLADALGIQIRIFSLVTGQNLDMCITPFAQNTANPRVFLVFTGIHYDILYTT